MRTRQRAVASGKHPHRCRHHVARLGRVALCRAGFVASPRADYGDYLAYARRKGADYLLVDERELLVLRPHLSFLLDDAHPPVELEPVFKSRDGKGLTIVYRIKD